MGLIRKIVYLSVFSLGLGTAFYMTGKYQTVYSFSQKFTQLVDAKADKIFSDLGKKFKHKTNSGDYSLKGNTSSLDDCVGGRK